MNGYLLILLGFNMSLILVRTFEACASIRNYFILDVLKIFHGNRK